MKPETVQSPENAKNAPLHGMFNAIPRRYDLLNKIITWGLDRRWRRLAARECVVTAPRRVLDLCCGTGDLTIAMVKTAKSYTSITGLDYSATMLEVARAKAGARFGAGRITFQQAEAGSLPFDDEYFDTVGISFAFRNLTYKNPVARLHLAEIFRVLTPGGRCVIVESSQPRSEIIRWLFHVYLRLFVRPVGAWLSGNPGAYRYLAESAARYYTPDEVRDLLKASGFREVTYRPLAFGVAGIHVAVK